MNDVCSVYKLLPLSRPGVTRLCVYPRLRKERYGLTEPLPRRSHTLRDSHTTCPCHTQRVLVTHNVSFAHFITRSCSCVHSSGQRTVTYIKLLSFSHIRLRLNIQTVGSVYSSCLVGFTPGTLVSPHRPNTYSEVNWR